MERKPEDLDKWYAQKKNEEKVKETYESFISQIDEAKRDAVKNEYEDLVEGKELTPEKAKKYLSLAWKAVTGDEVEDVSKTKKTVGATATTP